MLCFCAHRYDDTATDTIDIVYVSRMKTTPTAVQLGTFNPDTFPCLALGVDRHKQQCEDTVCCLDRFNGLYTTLSSFDTYLRDENTPVRSEIQWQASCRLIDAPPSNTSAALLREAPDFVVGAFSGMPRSKKKKKKRKEKDQETNLKEMFRTIGDTEAVQVLGLMVVVSVSLNKFLPHSRVPSFNKFLATLSERISCQILIE